MRRLNVKTTILSIPRTGGTYANPRRSEELHQGVIKGRVMELLQITDDLLDSLFCDHRISDSLLKRFGVLEGATLPHRADSLLLSSKSPKLSILQNSVVSVILLNDIGAYPQKMVERRLAPQITFPVT